MFSLVFRGNCTIFESFSSSSSSSHAGHEKTSRAAERQQQSDRFGTEKKLVELGTEGSDVDGDVDRDADCGECARGTRQNKLIRSAKKCNKHTGGDFVVLECLMGATETGRASPAQRTGCVSETGRDEAAGGNLAFY